MIVGKVISISDDNLGKLKKGDRVIVAPYCYCGICYPCSIGRTNCCCDLKVLGIHVEGRMVEYFTHPEDMLLKLPDELLWDLAPIAEIEKTWRVLPMGYWKGSGISIALDLIGTVLANGNSVKTIGSFGDEVGLTQIMIAINPSMVNSTELTDQIVNDIIGDIKDSQPEKEGGEVYYPGELELRSMQENRAQGIPVVAEKWEEVLNF